MQFDMTEFVEQQKRAAERDRAGDGTPVTSRRPAVQKAKEKARPYYATQDQTSLYEEYLFGRATYAEGKQEKTWSDSITGRSSIRLISRGIFGAAAFTWGGRAASRQLQNYAVDEVRFNLETFKSKPLQLIAKTFDTVIAEPIKAGVRLIAPKGREEITANRAVRFRQKAYYHDQPGKEAGRSLGAEMVAVTFDFACASAADAGTRSLIQLMDPNIKKPWRDKDGKLDIESAAKSTASAVWRIFSKNQGEDWAAALPYIYQMKLQRNAIARWAPGFKLSSDLQVNGASSIINRQGHITGDYQKQGAVDLQLRFMGYNWYTLMYRETYDAISNHYHQWKDNHFKISMPKDFDPIDDTAEAVGSATRYIAKSAIKAGLYMMPAVPFFWVFRTPQSKWRAPLIYDNHDLEGTQNAHVMREPGVYVPEYSSKYDAQEFKQSTYAEGKRVWQGGIHSNGGHIVDQAYFGHTLRDGSNHIRPITPMGSDEMYKWKNQKTVFSKILNPFGWASYKTGSGLVHAGDWLERRSPGSLNWLGKGSAFEREKIMRTFVDASFSYTPYMIAKAEFALRVDDRGASGTEGEMDKAINKGIDSFVTFDMKGFGNSVRRVGDLLFDNDRDVSENHEVPKQAAPSPKVETTSIQMPQLSTPTKHILAHPNLETKAADYSHVDKLAKQRNQSHETFLYPESRTLQ